MQTIRDGHLIEIDVPEEQHLSLMMRDHFEVIRWKKFDRKKWPDTLPEDIQDALEMGYRGDCECQAIIWGYLNGVWYHISHACGGNSIWVSEIILPEGNLQEVDEFVWPEGLEAVEI